MIFQRFPTITSPLHGSRLIAVLPRLALQLRIDLVTEIEILATNLHRGSPYWAWPGIAQ